MDKNTITLSLIDTKLIATLNGRIFGQVYKTREEALEMYFDAARELAEKGILANNSSIIS